MEKQSPAVEQPGVNIHELVARVEKLENHVFAEAKEIVKDVIEFVEKPFVQHDLHPKATVAPSDLERAADAPQLHPVEPME